MVHLARYLPWRPDLVHVNDWQTALAPVFMLDQKLRDGWTAPPPTCLTIHNMSYQGNFPPAKFALTNLPGNYFQPDGLEFYGWMNCLKGGISFARPAHHGQPKIRAGNHHRALRLRAGRRFAPPPKRALRRPQRR